MHNTNKFPTMNNSYDYERIIRLTYNKVLDGNEVKLGQYVTNTKILFVKGQALLCNLVIDTNEKLHNY